jgi:hypothetical protein
VTPPQQVHGLLHHVLWRCGTQGRERSRGHDKNQATIGQNSKRRGASLRRFKDHLSRCLTYGVQTQIERFLLLGFKTLRAPPPPHRLHSEPPKGVRHGDYVHQPRPPARAKK